jgi:putative ABC transport system permease protein
MGLANLRRSPRKLVAVVLSLTLSMVLLGGVYSAVNSFDMDKYLAESIVSDFMVADAPMLEASTGDTDYEGVTDDFLAALSVAPGIADSGRVFFRENWHILPDFAYERAMEIFEKSGAAESDGYGVVEAFEKAHGGDMHIYGIDAFTAGKMSLAGSPVDYEKLSSGDYVLVTSFELGDDEDLPSYYEP